MEAIFNVKEVAALANVSERAVNKAIEEGVIKRPRKTGRSRNPRTLPFHAVAYAAVVSKLGVTLTKDRKLGLAKILESRRRGSMTSDPVEIAPALIADLPRLVGADLERRADAYARSREKVIEIDPDVLGGTPVMRGTRISVYSLLGRIDGGDPIDSILEDYPDLAKDEVETALTYARTHPLVGRPGGRPWRAAA